MITDPLGWCRQRKWGQGIRERLCVVDPRKLIARGVDKAGAIDSAGHWNDCSLAVIPACCASYVAVLVVHVDKGDVGDCNNTDAHDHVKSFGMLGGKHVLNIHEEGKKQWSCVHTPSTQAGAGLGTVISLLSLYLFPPLLACLQVSPSPSRIDPHLFYRHVHRSRCAHTRTPTHR